MHPEQTDPDPDRKRQTHRQPMLRVAKILMEISVVDCLVLDMSASGVRVSTPTMFVFPEAVRIELKSGAVYGATRCWQRGLETGFEFTGLLGLTGPAAKEIEGLHGWLCRSGVLDITARLAQERHYDHPELKAAAGAVEAAVRKLESVLLKASQPG